MHIQKVLNSSVVLVQDDSGEESILLGKGIGYGRKAGEPIERQPSDRVFLPLSNPDAQPMLELFSSIPASYLELTQTKKLVICLLLKVTTMTMTFWTLTLI